MQYKASVLYAITLNFSYHVVLLYLCVVEVVIVYVYFQAVDKGSGKTLPGTRGMLYTCMRSFLDTSVHDN